MYNLPRKIFITGIGTNIGKSYATGWLAREMQRYGQNVITQKLIQTGNKDMSEDIEVHRKVMGIGLQEADLNHTTAPIILSYPASPHLAAHLDGISVNYTKASEATEQLLKQYDNVLIEGAGGIMVPLTEDYLTIDYVKEHRLPVTVVTNGALGSISDTILTLEALKNRAIEIPAVIYNPYFDTDKVIAEDTVEYLRAFINKNYPKTLFLVMPATL